MERESVRLQALDMSASQARAGERREVYYRGHVQGVGFRYSVHRLASGFRVTGFVRNLPDGRVHLVAEGEPSELTRFLDAVADCMANYVRETLVDVRPAAGEFAGFEIRY